MIFLYTSPVFYSLSNIPEKFRAVCMLNPLTLIIENMRNIFLYGNNIDGVYYVISLGTGFFVFSIGIFIFERIKEGFADVL